MPFHVLTWVALAIIGGAIALAWSRRFLALGALAIANLLVFVLTELGPAKACMVLGQPRMVSAVRCDLSLHGDLLAQTEPVAFLQLFTSMFVHANFTHIIGNLIILIAFALPFEERIGHRRFLGVFVLTGLAAALIQSASAWGEIGLMMGASGAVFGIIGAFAGAFPRLVVPLPLPLLFIMIFVRMQVWVAAAIFGVLQIGLQYLSGYMPGGSQVAYLAHLGGLAVGLPIGWFFVRPRVQAAGRPATPVPLERLRPFARHRSAQNALEHMEENRDQADVFGAWQERFFHHASCPICDQALKPAGRARLKCEQGHHFDLREEDAGVRSARTAGSA